MSETRKRRLWLFGASTVVAGIVLVIAIAFNQSGSGPSNKSLAANARDTDALLTGIPQQGLSLGSPSAPLTLTEFADLQCPFCREYTLKVFPALVQRYVRAGKLRMEFRARYFIGPDSVIAARSAEAAGLQNRLWQFVDLFYKSQQDENSHYVRPKFLRRIGAAASLDVARLARDSAGAAVQQQLAAADGEASRFGIKSTPSFLLARAGEQPAKLTYSSFSPGEFEGKIDAKLGT
jgi:protein-disulfide isomerase